MGTPDLIVTPGVPSALDDTICSIDAMAEANDTLFNYRWNKGDDFEMYSLRYTDREAGFEILLVSGADEPQIMFYELRDKSRPMAEIEKIMQPFERAMTSPQPRSNCEAEPVLF